jgi:hypothetical protein
MKFLIVLFTAFTMHQAHAEMALTDDLTASCSNVSKIGVLAKDNMPYWANPNDNDMDVEACYIAIINVIEQNHINKNFRGKKNSPVEILTTDEEFVAFIQSHQTEDSYFNTEVPQTSSLIQPPHTAFEEFFKN